MIYGSLCDQLSNVFYKFINGPVRDGIECNDYAIAVIGESAARTTCANIECKDVHGAIVDTEKLIVNS